MAVERIEVKADPEVVAAWQSHFDEPLQVDPTWLTCGELAEIAGVGGTTMRARLRAGVKSGLYVTQKAYRTRPSDGQRALVPVFKLAEQPTTKKRGRK